MDQVYKSFEKKLKACLEEDFVTQILDIGTCSLHIVNNAFLEGLKELKNEINLDEFAIDLHFFMKYSAVRREDFVNIVSVMEITAHFLLRHCTTRWLSLDKVLVQIIEQYENLKEYFLKTLPKLPGFHGKNGVEQTECYQRIKSNLNSPGALA